MGKPFNQLTASSITEESSYSNAADFVVPFGSVIKLNALILPNGDTNSLTCSS